MADGGHGKRPAPVRVKGVCQRCGERSSVPKRYLCAKCIERRCERCDSTQAVSKYGKLCKGCAGKARTAGRTDVHHWTPAEDEVIRAAYAEHYGKKALHVAERRLGLSRESIKSRAQTIGAARTAAKAPPWSRTTGSVSSAQYRCALMVRSPLSCAWAWALARGTSHLVRLSICGQ
jgi:hypothetical protein